MRSYEDRLAYNRAYYAANRDKFIARNWMKNYNMTPEERKERLDSQSNECAACGTAFAEMDPKHIHADHDHACCSGITSCGKCVRGFLCQGCNNALGALKDDPDRVLGLYDYLLGWLVRKTFEEGVA